MVASAARGMIPQEISCPFCGQTIPVREIPDHLRTAHPERFAAVTQWHVDFKRAWGKAVIPSLVVWAAVFLLGLLLFLSRGGDAGLFVFGMIIALIVLPVGALAYAGRSTRTESRRLRGSELRCRICDATLPGTELKGHVRSVHPAYARHLLVAKAYVLGSLSVVVVLFALVLPLVAPYAVGSSSWGRTSAEAILLSWLGLVAAWAHREPGYLARARAAWHGFRT